MAPDPYGRTRTFRKQPPKPVVKKPSKPGQRPNPVPDVRGKNNTVPAPAPTRSAPGVRGGGGRGAPVVSRTDTPPSGRGARPAALTTKQWQQKLKAAGYNVTVDGISGPQTAMARKALAHGVDPKYWNKVWLKNHPPAGSPSGDQSGGSSGSSSPDTGSGTSGTGTTKTATKPTGAASPETPTAETFDPNAYAQNAANAEFNPQIADARYNLGYAKKALPESLQDLSGWNQQVINTADKYGGTAGYDQGIQQLAESQVGGLFGGAYAGQAAAQAAPGMDAMLQNKASQGGFQDIMKSVYEAQGRDYARRATREGNNDIAKAQMGLSGLIQGKGQARAKYLGEGQQRAQDMAISQQALDQARALAGDEQAISKAKVSVAQTEAKNAPKIAQIEFQTAKLNMDKLQESSPEGLDDPEYVAGLSGELMRAIGGAEGGLRSNPKEAVKVLGSLVSQYPGLVGDPRVANMISATLRRMLATSHAKNQWTAWTIGKNGFPVLDKKKALKNAKAARERQGK